MDETDSNHRFRSIQHGIAAQASITPDNTAIASPGRQPLTYRQLQKLIEFQLAELNGAGIGRGDRVAIVMPNGPEMAAAFLSVAAGASAAPLNPAYRVTEFEYYLADIRAKTLIIQEDMDSPARVAAARLSIPIVELFPQFDQAAGSFRLSGATERTERPAYSMAEDEALILHTSGTTSRPKIVPLSQRNLCTSAHNIAAALALTRQDLCLNIMPLFHIHGLMAGLLASLTVGAGVFCSPGFNRDNFFGWLKAARPTWFTAVPTMHMAILEAADEYRDIIAQTPLRFVRSSSASLPPRVMARMEEIFNVPVIEAYGMTEAAHQIASNPLPPAARKPGSVGISAGPEVAIMDATGNLLSSGESGEIVIRGANVTAGYDNNPEANAQAYTRDWFRTGDQGQLDEDGYLYLRGRIKEIINRGGEKISPREVDEALLEHPDVLQAVTFAVPHERLGEDIAAAVVVKVQAALTGDALRQGLFGRLATFKIPNKILIVDEIPKGPTGKIQRIGLAEKLADRLGSVYTPPRTPLETCLAEIFAQALGTGVSIGMHDNFFSAGGDSLRGAQAIDLIRDRFQCDLPVTALFHFPTIAKLAGQIREKSSLNQSTISRKSDRVSLPLSLAQQRLWLLEQLEPEHSINNVTRTLHLRGDLNHAALELALDKMIARHETLRTTFAIHDIDPMQNIAASAPSTITTIDLANLTPHRQHEEAMRLAGNEARHSFDVKRLPLMRILLIKLSSQEHILIITMHHMISDGWSMGIFSRELATFYRSHLLNEPPHLRELPIQYADYTEWQRRWLQGEEIKPLVDYWKRQLSGAARLELPFDRPYTKTPDYRAARRSLTLSAELTHKIQALGQEENCTLFITILASFSVLLHRYTGETDIVIGAPVSGRHGLNSTKDLIGFFVNTLALRCDLSTNPSFRQLLGRVRNMALESYKHSALPFEKLVEALRPDRLDSRNPIFDVMINYHEASWHTFKLERLAVTEWKLAEPLIDVALSLDISLANDKLHLSLVYQPALLDEWRINNMLGHLNTLLEGCIAEPERPISTLPLLTHAERDMILNQWNNTAGAYPHDKTIHSLFEQQAQATPQATALTHKDRQLSYSELNIRANQLAHYLIARNVRADTLVGICMPRSPEMIIGLLAILKAGGAYLPLDPAYPYELLHLMMEDANISLLLTHSHLPFATLSIAVRLDSDWLSIEGLPRDNPRTTTGPDNLAYVIYTSGSTGKPKGVAIHHRALVNYIIGTAEHFGLIPGDRLLQFSTINFDIAAEEIFTTLIAGATLILRTDAMLASTAIFQDKCRLLKISKLILPTAYWHEMVAQIAEEKLPWPESVKLVVIGGEQASEKKLATWLENVPDDVRLINAYGPTETTIAATMADLHTPGCAARVDKITIGKPLRNSRAYILDKTLQPLPAGIIGELYIGGIGVCRGYLNRPQLTAERFIVDPYSADPGARIYNTGDRARYGPDGNIEYLGRSDHQIKLRGFRIELGEIETVLQLQVGVRDAVVIARKDHPGNTYLAAYIIPESPNLQLNTLHATLKEKLAPHMLPSNYTLLDKFPLTSSHKVDRNALPAPAHAHLRPENAYLPPQTYYEQKIAAIWNESMAVSNPGLNDNFFELGGHSLLATRVIARINQAFNTSLPLRALFETPTISGLALSLIERKFRILPETTRMTLLERLETLSEATAEQLLTETSTEKDT